VDGKQPLSREDYDYHIERGDVADTRFDQVCNDLVVALRNGLLKANGRLLVFDPPHTSLGVADVDSAGARSEPWVDFVERLERPFGEPDRFHIVLNRDLDIPAALWDLRLYDWREDCLRSPWDVQPHACFRWVCVSTEQLASALRDEASPIERSPRVGRLPTYNWEDFYIEIVVRADRPDGLPATQAELVRQMASWCEDKWGKQPAESMLKEKISRIYRRKANSDQ
jgi:hypothetical protein